MAERKLPARTPLEKALAECEACDLVDALTVDVLNEIAQDYHINPIELEKAFNA